MVTTRRQRAGSAEPTLSQQPEPSASPSPARRSTGAARATRGNSRLVATAQQLESQLEAIEEDTAHHEDAVGIAGTTTVALPSTSKQQLQDEDEAMHEGRRAAAAERACTSGSSDDEEEDDEEGIFGPSMMGQLAGSLRAALLAKAGMRERAASPPPGGAGPSKQEAQGGEPHILRWQPAVKLPKQTVAQRVAPGSGADKEKGLAKRLVVPPRAAPSGPGAAAAATEGPSARKWYELPATQITDEIKQELRLLRLRGAYDPKRFYKSFDETKFPKHFQIGTVLDSPQEFYSSRLTKKERGASITEEIMADANISHARKKRYGKIQAEATKYLKVKKRKTELKRAAAKKQRPKH